MRTILERSGATKVLAECGEGTLAYNLAISGEHERDGLSIVAVLRGAAETMALRFRR